MMSASTEGPERLADILREILALSETKQSDHTGGTDDCNNLVDAQNVNEIDQRCAGGNQRNHQHSQR